MTAGLPSVRLLLVPALLGALATSAAAGDAEDAGGRVDPAVWAAADAEARWLLYRRSVDDGDAAAEAAWIAFLAQREAWDQLEWIALTSRRTAALEALVRANAPPWVRVAVWTLAARSSHALDGARHHLVQERPGVARAWFARFPEAAEGAAATVNDLLRSQEGGEEGAAAHLLPPYDAQTLLGALRAPPHLQALGQASHAALGRPYVHQVERALEALARSRLAGDPWDRLHRDLLDHPHARVRRAAALAYTRRPPTAIPLDALLRHVDDPGEVAGVRAAMLLGLSYAEDPAAYATLLETSLDPDHPAWQAAVSRLGDLDDGFAPAAWEILALEGDAATLARDTAARIGERATARRPKALARRVPVVLRRGAAVARQSPSLATSLVPWTLSFLRAHVEEPGFREALEDALDDDADTPAGPKTARLRGLVEDLLAENAEHRATEDG